MEPPSGDGGDVEPGRGRLRVHQASMEPPSGDGGDVASSTAVTRFTALQWSRRRVTAETAPRKSTTFSKT